MRKLIRIYLVNFVSLYITTNYIQGLTVNGGIKSMAFGALIFMLINFLLVPLLKILFLPLNLLTVGLFGWLINVLALYALTTIVTDFALKAYFFPGATVLGLTIPAMQLSTFWVAVLASLMIGIITHFLQWLAH